MSLVSMEDAQLCCTHFVLHCSSHTPAHQGWLKQAARGHHQPPGAGISLPRTCSWALRKREWGEEWRKGEGKEKGGKGREKNKRLLESEINKKSPACLPCIPLFQAENLTDLLSLCEVIWVEVSVPIPGLHCRHMLCCFSPIDPSMLLIKY